MARPEASPNAGVNEHKGLFLRGTVGLGFADFTSKETPDDYSGPDPDSDGMVQDWSLALGGAVSPRLAFYGEMISTRLLESDGQPEGLKINASGLGAGFVYYTPRNVFISATMLVETHSVEVGGEKLARRRLAPGFAVKWGKEFWAADQLGLGAFLGMHWADTGVFESSDSEFKGWRTLSFSVGLSAVLN